MPTITLGNTAPVQAVKVDDTTAIKREPRPDLGNTVTTFVVPDNVGVGEALQTVSSVFASHHSDAKPAWVESDDEVVAQALSREFGCPVGRPDGWGEDEKTPAPAAVSETQTVAATDVASAAAVITPAPTSTPAAPTPPTQGASS